MTLFTLPHPPFYGHHSLGPQTTLYLPSDPPFPHYYYYFFLSKEKEIIKVEGVEAVEVVDHILFVTLHPNVKNLVGSIPSTFPITLHYVPPWPSGLLNHHHPLQVRACRPIPLPGCPRPEDHSSAQMRFGLRRAGGTSKHWLR